MMRTFNCKYEAEQYLDSIGAKPKGDYWIIKGPVDPFYGDYEITSLIELRECVIAENYGVGSFYEIRFF